MNANGHSRRHRRNELRAARERAELRQLQLQESLLESLPFSFGWPGHAPNDWTYTDAQGKQWLPVGTGGNLAARKDGAHHPFVWTEQQLDWERARHRWLVTENPVAAGIVSRLATFSVRTGYGYEAQPAKRYRKEAAAVELAAQVQECVDEFCDLNTFPAMELEAALRDPTDGEVYVRSFAQDDGTTLARIIEPEQIRQPPGTDSNWLFGKESAPRDVCNTLSYAVCYDPDNPADWEQVDAADVSEMKANVPSTVKRGLSDFHGGTADMVEGAWKLLTAMRTGATISACIPWIEQFEAGAAAVSGNIAATKNLNQQGFIHPVTGREQHFRQFQPGEILKVGKGRQYLPPPLASNTTNYIATEQACLRTIGNRWDMPEYMVSGDASNANYASTLVAGSPFVIAVEMRQSRLKRLFLRVLWVAIRNAANAGRFVVVGRRYTAEEVERLVDVQATPPAVAIANKAEESAVDQADIAAGVMSKKTRRAKIGLDDEQERTNIAEEPPAPQPGQPQAGGLPGMGVAESRLADLRARYGQDAARVVAEAASRVLTEVKDDTGREHDESGRFGSGGGGKAPHEMTRKEHAAAHKQAVASALEAGHNVPDHVLADYPDLAKQHGREVAKPAPAGLPDHLQPHAKAVADAIANQPEDASSVGKAKELAGSLQHLSADELKAVATEAGIDTRGARSKTAVLALIQHKSSEAYRAVQSIQV